MTQNIGGLFVLFLVTCWFHVIRGSSVMKFNLVVRTQTCIFAKSAEPNIHSFSTGKNVKVLPK
jgi:hypothetical protein